MCECADDTGVTVAVGQQPSHTAYARNVNNSAPIPVNTGMPMRIPTATAIPLVVWLLLISFYPLFTAVWKLFTAMNRIAECVSGQKIRVY